MANDPAFLLYSQDFLTGTYTMTNEQVGKYIRLLCLQHQKGRLSAREVETVLGKPDPDIYQKFYKETDDAGEVYYFNARLREEAEKRSRFCASRRDNRLKKQVLNTCSTSVERMEIENENEIVNNKKSKRKPKASRVDVPETLAADLLLECFGDIDPREFIEAWETWKNYKSSQFGFKFKTINTEITAIKNLKNLSNGELKRAVEIINQSIANGWKGLFNLREDGTGKQTANVERYRARVDYANRHN